MAYIETLESALPRWPAEEGYPGWILPVHQQGVTRGLSCKDIMKLNIGTRAIACASDKAYTPKLTSAVYPSNVPVALMSVEGNTVAFMMGHHACPMQCDPDVILGPTYEVYRGINMLINPDGTVTVIDMTNGSEPSKTFASREELEMSDYFQNTLASLDPRNIDSDMKQELETLGSVRKDFSDLGAKDRSGAFNELWKVAPAVPIEDKVAPFVADAFERDCSSESIWAMNQILPGTDRKSIEFAVTSECRPESPEDVPPFGISDPSSVDFRRPDPVLLSPTPASTDLDGAIDFRRPDPVLLSPIPASTDLDGAIEFQIAPKVKLRLPQ